jgi:cell division protein FtsN
MSPEHDDDRTNANPGDPWGDEAPSSLLSRTWVRVALVVIVLGVIAAIATPYIRQSLNLPASTVATTRAGGSAQKASSPGEPTTTQASVAATASTPAPAAAAGPAASESSSAAAPGAAAQKPASAPSGPASERKPAAAAVESKREAAKPETSKAPSAKGPGAKSTATKTVAANATSPKTAPPKGAAAAAPAKDATATKTIGAETGEYWVQVGAFLDPEAAKRVAASLAKQRYRVEQSTTVPPAGQTPAAPARGAATKAAASGADEYDVFVAGTTPADVVAKLTAKGLAAEAQKDGALVKPSLPLRDAVQLSKDLANEGFKVQVKRAAGAAAPAPSAAPSAGAAPVTLHRVRVGAFPDRAAAVAALKQLQEQGFKPFIAKDAQ